MSSFRIRPRFKYLIESEKSELELKIRNSLQTEKQFTVNYLPGHIYLKINTSNQHFWSPQLHLSFEQEGPNVIVRGLYGPNPTLWAVFFFGYLALGILAIFIVMWGTIPLESWDGCVGAVGETGAGSWCSYPIFCRTSGTKTGSPTNVRYAPFIRKRNWRQNRYFLGYW